MPFLPQLFPLICSGETFGNLLNKTGETGGIAALQQIIKQRL